MLPRQNIIKAKCWQGKMLPRQNVTRQNVTRQSVTRQNVTDTPSTRVSNQNSVARNCEQLCRIARNCSRISRNSAKLRGNFNARNCAQVKFTCIGNPTLHSSSILNFLLYFLILCIRLYTLYIVVVYNLVPSTPDTGHPYCLVSILNAILLLIFINFFLTGNGLKIMSSYKAHGRIA